MTTFGPLLLLMSFGTIIVGVFRFHHFLPSIELIAPILGISKRSSSKLATKKSRHNGKPKNHHDEEDRPVPSFLRSYTRNAQDDFVQGLPGLDYDPGFRQFAGYLTVDPHHGRRIFYWYIESQGNPVEDPVVLWTNGGPGCSGLVGFGTEHGPFYISKNGTLSENPWSWNKLASMLYIEQPSGVGFSYSDTHSDYKTGDGPAARDNYHLILAFLHRFPERQDNPFYISSESYGGHYMPQLTLEIVKHNTDSFINFKGMMVGNPFVDPFSNTVTQTRAFYSHGLLAKPLFDKWSDSCTEPSNYDSKKCQDLEVDMFKGLYGKINPYALDYPICVETKEAKRHSHQHHGRHSRRLDDDTSSQAQKLLNASTAGGPPFLPTEDRYRPCSEEHLNAYLNRAEVQKALHVFSHSKKKIKWIECSDSISYNEKDFSASIVETYKELIQKAVDYNLQVFIFSGDDDSVCSTAGTQYWIWDLGWKAQEDELWKSWEVEKEVAGYVTKFDLGTDTKGSFTFATVHGAGHEVPAYRPMEALELFRKVLDGEWY